MRRINTATRAINLFGAGKDGWKGGNPATNDSATQQNAEWFNAVQEEIANVIESTGVSLNANSRTQLRDAIVAMIVAGGGTGSLKRSFALDSGAILREYGNQATATIGYFATGITCNCAVNQSTGAWAGRDIAGICWAEKINEAAGVKEYWYAATAAAGTTPTWVLVSSLDSSTGVMTLPSTSAAAVNQEVATADYVRAQLVSGGINSDGFRVRKELPEGTDPFAIVEDFDGDFFAVNSPNVPASLAGKYLRLQVSRHPLTSTQNVPNGQYLYAFYTLSDIQSGAKEECRAETDYVTGAVTYSPWTPVGSGGGGGGYAGTNWQDVTSLRTTGVNYVNSSSSQNLEVSIETLDSGAQSQVRVTINGQALQDFWISPLGRRASIHFTVPPLQSYSLADIQAGTNFIKWNERLL